MHERARHGKGNAFTGLPRRQHLPPAAFVAALIYVLVAPGSSQAAATDDLARIDELIAAGRHEEALVGIARVEERLAPSDRLTAWEIDFRGEVVQLAHGKKHLYYLLNLPNARKDAPGRPLELESVRAIYDRSGHRFAVVCVDLDTGRVIWSRPVEGLVDLVVDPRTDDVHLVQQLLLTLSAESGALIDRQSLGENWRQVEGLLLDGTPSLLPATDGWKRKPALQRLLYDPGAGVAHSVAVYGPTAPDGSCRMELAERGWSCKRVGKGGIGWTVEGPLYPRDQTPVAHAGRVAFISGAESSRGIVVSVDPTTGLSRWTATLGWGTYQPRRHTLPAGGIPRRNWTPLAAAGGELLAVDGSGRLTLLDPGSGTKLATPRLAGEYLEMPFSYDGQLIVASYRWVRSYSMASLLEPEASVDAALEVRKARSLLALGRFDEALRVADRLVERAPELAAAWQEKADAAAAVEGPTVERFSRAQALSLSGGVTDRALHDGWGLLRIFDLEGKPSRWLALLDDHVHAATLAGFLWDVHVDDLSLGWVRQLEHDYDASRVQISTELTGWVDHRHQPWPGAVAAPVPEIPAAGKPKLPPVDWLIRGGVDRISHAVPWRGRQFRSVKGGRVMVLSDGVMRRPAPLLDDIGEWRIHIGPGGPLGYGEGVYELDDDLRPTRWLIRPLLAGAKAERLRVAEIATTLETIGLVVASADGAALQVYSWQGRLLGEAPLGPLLSNSFYGPYAGQLIPLGRGYLFSDRQLTWVSSDEDRPAWRFGPPLERTETNPVRQRWRYFGDPLVTAGCLYVTGLDGQLFVFDVGRITGMPTTP